MRIWFGLVGVLVPVGMLAAPVGAQAPVADELLLPTTVLDGLRLTDEEAADLELPSDPECGTIAEALETTAENVQSEASQRRTGRRDRSIDYVVRVFDTPRSARAYFDPWADSEVAEECVEARLERDAPGFGADLVADDREDVDLGVPVSAFLGGGFYETDRGEREIVNETVVARAGTVVLEASFTARRDGFPEYARRIERALRGVVRRIDG